MTRSKKARSCELTRQTKETNVKLSLNLDGVGESRINLSDEFFKHMLDTLAKHASFDLVINASGDIAHHLIEDVAITLGKGLRDALGDDPIDRVATSVVPMDEALVLVSVDLIDRPYVKVEVPDLMFEHFLRSFAMESRATIHSQVIRGQDNHHIIEATFKALGLSLKKATRRSDLLMSTKSKVEWKRKG